MIIVALIMIGAFLSPASGSADRSVEDRIRAAIEFLIGQYISNSTYPGFTHDAQAKVIYAEDNGLAALALASYQQTHFSGEFHEYLKRAVEFIESAQTDLGDFHEFYCPANRSWGPSHGMYHWNSYAFMGAAYAAYVISEQVATERGYWSTIVNRLRPYVDSWLMEKQLASGALLFSYPGGGSKPDVAANAAMLVGLVHLSLFEHNWGDRSLAIRYATWSQSVARWLWSLQERNEASWGRGGFYSDSSRTLQIAYENGLAMFGLNKYYSAIDLLLSHYEPTASELRTAMIEWAEAYVGKTLDRWGGVPYERNSHEIVAYPKETLSASSVLQAMIDVWINIGGPADARSGPPFYWADAMKIYQWMTGGNELSADLQTGRSVTGTGEGFSGGIGRNGLIEGSDTATTSLALYAFVRAGYVRIPEFPMVLLVLPIALVLTMTALLTHRGRRLNQRRRAFMDMSGSNYPAYISSHERRRTCMRMRCA